MKKIITILSLLLLLACPTVDAKSNKAEITFSENTYDFGTISEHGGKITHSFAFTNTGDANLVILNATADCGCTVPEYPQAPIAPGKTGVIKVTFNPLYRPGSFSKVITIRTNGKQKKVRLKITGIVNNNR